MLNNIRDFGARGDGVTDDRAAIQAAIDDAVAHDRGGILIPAGTYRVSRVDAPGGRWSVDLNGVHDFMVTGEGPRSIVRLVDTAGPTGDWHVLILRNGCRRVVIADLVLDGNRTGLAAPDEQSHGIEAEPGTEDLVVDRCVVRECHGDGMRLLGSPAAHVTRVRVANSLFQTNKRSGLTMQRALSQISVAHCIFDGTVTDQSIDFEPSGTDGPSELVIEGCLIRHTNGTPAVTLSGISGHDPLVRCRFSDNLVLGGRIFCTDVQQLAIQNNVVLAPTGTTLAVNRGGDTIVISGNLLIGEDPAAKVLLALTEVNQRQVTRALVADNLCVARAGDGIQCISSDDVAVQGNMIVAAGACARAIHVRAETSPVDHLAIRNNDITVEDTGHWSDGIRIAVRAPHHVGHVSVIGNAVHGAGSGVVFAGPAFRQLPVCALNRIADDVASPLVGIAQLPFASLIVGGGTSRGGTTEHSGGGRTLVGLGDPNQTQVIGNVGDVFQRLDGTPGATLYIKESGDGTGMGWTAK